MQYYARSRKVDAPHNVFNDLEDPTAAVTPNPTLQPGKYADIVQRRLTR
jgi:hypothetical protein